MVAPLHQKTSRFRSNPIPYAIFTTGLTGLIFNLAIIFTFQTLYGYLYDQIGLLVALFMMGIALGSHPHDRDVWINRKRSPSSFLEQSCGIILFSLLLPFGFLRWHVASSIGDWGFAGGHLLGSSFLSGFAHGPSVSPGHQNLSREPADEGNPGPDRRSHLWAGPSGRFSRGIAGRNPFPPHPGSEGNLFLDGDDQNEQPSPFHRIHAGLSKSLSVGPVGPGWSPLPNLEKRVIRGRIIGR